MKLLITLISLSCSVQILSAQLVTLPVSQYVHVDSLKNELRSTSNDTLKVVLLNKLRYIYFFEKANLDSALHFSMQLLSLAHKLNYKIDEAYAYDLVADILNFQHNPGTLENFFKGIKIAEDLGSENNMLPRQYLEMMTYWHPDFTSLLAKHNWTPGYFRRAILGSLYQDLGRAYGKVMPNQQRLFFYLSRAIEIYKIQEDTSGLAFCYINIAEYFRSTNQLDSCLFYAQKGYDLYRIYKGSLQGEETFALSVLGTVHFKKGNYPLALDELRRADSIGLKYQQGKNWLSAFTLSEYFLEKNEFDSSIYYSTKSYNLANKIGLPEEMQKASAILANAYERKGINDSALKYFRLTVALNDSLNNAGKTRKLQSQDFDEQMHRQELDDEKNKLKLYFLFGGLGALLIIAAALLRNNVLRRKTNIALHEKNEQIGKTLTELKSTQAQLIQSEKMASLGELTAGIAHEIQNPLNFVNNFSDVNKELLSEMRAEITKGNYDEVNALIKDVEDNEEKINHHGKRAEVIVKGMLQHSQASTGKKELANINALADEYLRLAYHGLRGKDNSFNVTIKTDFDETISNINIIPQDIGRVLLNLYNNAFYAVNEKKKAADKGLPTFERLATLYDPTVSVSTKKSGGSILISIKDNGNGIPQKIVDKIFQPFFTTKPTGQGTGLGLSLAYDIVKAHGGELKVETTEGEGSVFNIQIPIH